MSEKKPYSDPFANMPKPRFYENAAPAKPTPARRANAETARQALAAAEAKAMHKFAHEPTSKKGKPHAKVPARAEGAKPAGGRPKVIDGEPWTAAGISKRTWYRRQKEGNDVT